MFGYLIEKEALMDGRPSPLINREMRAKRGTAHIDKGS
jgi:hypothetical protein